MESSENLDLIHSNKKYSPLEILYELYNLIPRQRKLEKKIKRKKNLITNNKLYEENRRKINNLFGDLSPQYNIYQLYHLLKINNQYLKNLNKARKKRCIDVDTYESLRLEHLQNISSIESNLKELKILAEVYFNIVQQNNLSLVDKQAEDWNLWATTDIKFRECWRNIKDVEKQRIPLINRLTFLKTRIIWQEKRHKLIKIFNYVQEFIPPRDPYIRFQNQMTTKNHFKNEDFKSKQLEINNMVSNEKKESHILLIQKRAKNGQIDLKWYIDEIINSYKEEIIKARRKLGFKAHQTLFDDNPLKAEDIDNLEEIATKKGRAKYFWYGLIYEISEIVIRSSLS